MLNAGVLIGLRATRERDARLTGRTVRDDDFILHHRFVAMLGITTTFHKLRHYSAMKVVAGRLGHASVVTTDRSSAAGCRRHASKRRRLTGRTAPGATRPSSGRVPGNSK
jgi:hypothetical protein